VEQLQVWPGQVQDTPEEKNRTTGVQESGITQGHRHAREATSWAVAAVGIAVCRGHAGAGGARSGRENRSTAADRAPGWLYGIGWGAVFGGYFFSGLRCGLQKFGELSKPHGAAL